MSRSSYHPYFIDEQTKTSGDTYLACTQPSQFLSEPKVHALNLYAFLPPSAYLPVLCGPQLFDHIAECLANFMDKRSKSKIRSLFGFYLLLPLPPNKTRRGKMNPSDIFVASFFGLGGLERTLSHLLLW